MIRSQGVGGRHSAFVRFATAEEAHAAITGLASQILPGDEVPITVRFAHDKKQQQLYPQKPSQPQILPWMKRLLPYIIPNYVPLRQQKRSAGADLVSSSKRQMLQPSDSSASGTYKLYVSNLEPDVNEDTLMRLFQPFGHVEEVLVMNRYAILILEAVPT